VEKPSRIRGNGFKIPALRLRIERAERKGRFARTGYSGKNHQGIPGNVNINITKVVFPGAPDTDNCSIDRTVVQRIRFRKSGPENWSERIVEQSLTAASAILLRRQQAREIAKIQRLCPVGAAG
jgi:hypothetical protein